MLSSLCPERDSNSHGTLVPGDFESRDGSIHHNNLAHSHSASVGVRSRPIPSFPAHSDTNLITTGLVTGLVAVHLFLRGVFTGGWNVQEWNEVLA